MFKARIILSRIKKGTQNNRWHYENEIFESERFSHQKYYNKLQFIWFFLYISCPFCWKPVKACGYKMDCILLTSSKTFPRHGPIPPLFWWNGRVWWWLWCWVLNRQVCRVPTAHSVRIKFALQLVPRNGICWIYGDMYKSHVDSFNHQHSRVSLYWMEMRIWRGHYRVSVISG